jgi:putative glutamine amidotransferase
MQKRAYIGALIDAGCVPLPIPPGPPDRIRILYEFCDGLLLGGGKDIDPRAYGRSPVTPYEDECQPDLDQLELTLVRWAQQDRRPLLGICRGAQVLNVALGGTLWQDLTAQTGLAGHGGDGADPSPGHDVRIESGSRLLGILGRRQVSVNSRHHQAIRELGDGLRVSARAPDGVVEAIESSGGWFAVAVQWHPEEMLTGADHAAALFAALAGVCVPAPLRATAAPVPASGGTP